MPEERRAVAQQRVLPHLAQRGRLPLAELVRRLVGGALRLPDPDVSGASHQLHAAQHPAHRRQTPRKIPPRSLSAAVAWALHEREREGRQVEALAPIAWKPAASMPQQGEQLDRLFPELPQQTRAGTQAPRRTLQGEE